MPQPEKNTTQLAFDILRGFWLLRDAESLMPYVNAFLNHLTIKAENQPAKPMLYNENSECEDPLQNTQNQVKKVVIIPLHGATVKYWNCFTDGTVSIADSIINYANCDDVVGIVLDIDSPGGAVNSIMPMIQAINKVKELGKPIIAHCDQCASAALWIASQCDAVYMDNEMSEIGSIGAYASIFDNRNNLQTGEKIITIYADESGEKNKAVRDALEGRYETLKKELSEIVTRFTNSVKAGRPNLDPNAEGVFSGAMFYAENAVKIGLADGLLTLEECIENVFVRAELNN